MKDDIEIQTVATAIAERERNEADAADDTSVMTETSVYQFLARRFPGEAICVNTELWHRPWCPDGPMQYAYTITIFSGTNIAYWARATTLPEAMKSVMRQAIANEMSPTVATECATSRPQQAAA